MNPFSFPWRFRGGVESLELGKGFVAFAFCRIYTEDIEPDLCVESISALCWNPKYSVLSLD